MAKVAASISIGVEINYLGSYKEDNTSTNIKNHIPDFEQ